MKTFKRALQQVAFAVLLVLGASELAQLTVAIAQDPPADPEPTVTSISSGLWTMHKNEKEVWFTPPDHFKPEWDVWFSTHVTFCRAQQKETHTRPDGTTFVSDNSYESVPDEEGETLSAEMFTGRMTKYPWVASREKDDPGIPRTQIERNFLKMILDKLDAKNSELTDEEWADPYKRLGVAMHVDGHIEFEEGPEIFKMIGTAFYLFPRKGTLTVLAEDDYYMWTLKGDTSLTWPRDQDHGTPPAATGTGDNTGG